MATGTSNKWIWITIAIVLILVVGIGVYSYASKPSGGGNQPPSGPAPSGDSPPTDSTTPAQTVHKYTCETKKVCQGRTGYANWVKTGTQKKCIASNVSQGLCLSDCLGTCYTWE